MNYYKIVLRGEVIGVGVMFARWNIDKRRYCYCDPDDAECVQDVITNEFYHDDWLKDLPAGAQQISSATVTMIDATEYDELYNLLIDGEEIPEPEPEPEPTPEPAPDEGEDEGKPMTVQQMREKILEQQDTITMLTDCILEMSEIVYGE